jgi:hypothetical protein
MERKAHPRFSHFRLIVLFVVAELSIYFSIPILLWLRLIHEETYVQLTSHILLGFFIIDGAALLFLGFAPHLFKFLIDYRKPPKSKGNESGQRKLVAVQ